MHVELNLRHLSHPMNPDESVLFFSSTRAALYHIEAHLLQDGEGDVWAVLVGMPELRDGKARARRRKAIYKSSEVVQELYDAYATETERSLTEARGLQWVARDTSGGREEKETTVYIAMGLSGVVTITQEHHGRRGVVKTSFVAGASRSDLTTRRQGRPTLPGRPVLETSRARRRRRSRSKREGWSPQRRYYQEVFRPGVQTIRTMELFLPPLRISHGGRGVGRPPGTPGQNSVRKGRGGAFLQRGAARPRQIGIIRRALPPMSQLGWEEWAALCERFGRKLEWPEENGP